MIKNKLKQVEKITFAIDIRNNLEQKTFQFATFYLSS